LKCEFGWKIAKKYFQGLGEEDKQQIPFGDDNKKSRADAAATLRLALRQGRTNSRFPLGMTMRKATAQQQEQPSVTNRPRLIDDQISPQYTG
jgi:hypothetical protein